MANEKNLTHSGKVVISICLGYIDIYKSKSMKDNSTQFCKGFYAQMLSLYSSFI